MLTVLLCGAGGHAAVIADCLAAAGVGVAGLFAQEPPARDWGAVPYLGDYDGDRLPNLPLLLALGDNVQRRRLASLVTHRCATVIHPSVLLSPSAEVGRGSALFHGAIVQAGARLGCHVIINTGATVDHDCRVGDFAHVAPGCSLCGNVTVGEGALLGVGSRFRPGVTVGAWAVVGAGAVVVGDVPPGAVFTGVPARARRVIRRDRG